MDRIWVKRLLPVAIIILALLIGRVLVALQAEPVKKPKVQPSPNVEILTVERGPLQLLVNSQGTVAAKRTVAWASEVAGRVIWVAPEFVEGAEVSAGTPLLKLDTTDYRVAVAEAEASLADANLALTEEMNEYRRGTTYRANNQQAASADLRQPKLAQVEAKVKAAEERLRQAKLDLGHTEIKAPFAAVIDKKAVDLGQYVAVNSTLFHLLGLDSAEVRLPITATDIGFLPGFITTMTDARPAVTLTADFGPLKQQWQGELVRVERRIDTDTRTYFAVVEVQKPYDTSLHASPLTVGLFVDALIEGITVNDSVRIPRQALHDDHFVYLVENQRLQRREVAVLRHEKGVVVVSEGLHNGDQLVMTKLDLMVDGMKVTAVPAKSKVVAAALATPQNAESDLPKGALNNDQ